VVYCASEEDRLPGQILQIKSIDINEEYDNQKDGYEYPQDGVAFLSSVIYVIHGFVFRKVKIQKLYGKKIKTWLFFEYRTLNADDFFRFRSPVKAYKS
jgi:hypothetical protein